MSFWNSLPWEQIDRIGIILGYITFIPLMWAIISYFRYNRMIRKSINSAISRAGTHKPVYIELTGKNIVTATAEKYLRKLDLEGEILPHITLERKGVDFSNNNEIEKLKLSIMKLKLDAMSESPDCIHLFYSGPVAVAIMIGEIFSNCKNVYIYHKQDESYLRVTKI